MKKSVCYILCTIMALASISVPQRASADSRLLADVEQTLVASCNIGMGYAIKPVKKNVESGFCQSPANIYLVNQTRGI